MLLRRHCPLKMLKEIAGYVSEPKFFALIDMKSRFCQLTVSKKAKKYLAVSTPCGRYTF